MGVLDIFGFEFVEEERLNPRERIVNSFEQFCINLCNEQLQNQFIEVVFQVAQTLTLKQLKPKLKNANLTLTQNVNLKPLQSVTILQPTTLTSPLALALSGVT